MKRNSRTVVGAVLIGALMLVSHAAYAAGYNVWVQDMSAATNYFVAADCKGAGDPYVCCTSAGNGCGACTATGYWDGKTVPRCDDTTAGGGFDFLLSTSDGGTAALSAIITAIKTVNLSNAAGAAQATGTMCYDYELLSIPSLPQSGTAGLQISNNYACTTGGGSPAPWQCCTGSHTGTCTGKVLSKINTTAHASESAMIFTTVTADGASVDCHLAGDVCTSNTTDTATTAENLATGASCSGTACNEQALLVRFNKYAHGASGCTGGVAGTQDVIGFKIAVQ